MTSVSTHTINTSYILEHWVIQLRIQCVHLWMATEVNLVKSNLVALAVSTQLAVAVTFLIK